MKELKLNDMRELNFNEIEEVSGGIFFAPWFLKTVGWGLIGTLTARALYEPNDGGPRGPTPAGPPRR